MSMHEQSENTDDPSGLSAVLAMYDKLRLEEWKALRASKRSCWKYKDASSIIKVCPCPFSQSDSYQTGVASRTGSEY